MGTGVRSASIINKFPYLGIGLIPATPELGQSLNYDGSGGAYVRKVAPRGICADAGLKDGDLLLEFEGHPFDRFGETQFGTQERMNIYDLAERVTVGKPVSFKIWRNGQSSVLSAKFEHIPQLHNYAIEEISEPVIQKVGYMIIGGIVFMDLTLNHLDFLLESSPILVAFYKGPNRLSSKVVISSILPESSIPEGALGDGDILDKVNGEHVNSLLELQNAMTKAHAHMVAEKSTKGSNLITIETTEGSKVVLDLATVVAKFGHATAGTSALDELNSLDLGKPQVTVLAQQDDPAVVSAPAPVAVSSSSPQDLPSFLMIHHASHPTSSLVSKKSSPPARTTRKIRFSH
jgi:hypothetical protein